MSFEENFQKIKVVIQEDLNFLEKEIQNLFTDKNPLSNDLSAFLTAPAKRLRPILGMLFLKCVFGEINAKQHNIMLSVELIHNATLIHDDVIDKSEKRRTQETLNTKFDNNLAVVAGDYLLSISMEKIIETNSIDVLKIFTGALKSTCLGEINQYFNKFKVTSIDEYIEKSRKKTALLFEIAVLSGLFLTETPIDEKLKQIAIDFSQNFGIAFQIRDDLINILTSDKIPNSDINSGIYTAPVIFGKQENEYLLEEEDILDALKKTTGIEKTKDLMDNYFRKSIDAICSIECTDINISKNIYTKAIIELVEVLKANL